MNALPLGGCESYRTLANCLRTISPYSGSLIENCPFPMAGLKLTNNWPSCSPSHKDLYYGPTAGRICAEAAAMSLRIIMSEADEFEWKGLHSLDFGRQCPCLQSLLQVGQ